MILQDPYLYHKRSQNRALAPINIRMVGLMVILILVSLNRSDIGEVHVYPSRRLLEAHFRKLLHIVSAHAREKLNLGRRVRFVGLEVEVDANEGYGNQFEEVKGEEVRLWAI